MSDYNAFLVGAIVVLLSAVISVSGLLIVRKKVSTEKLEQFNNVGGNMFQVVGTLYAVLIGLVVVDALQTVNDLRVTIDHEASAVANIYTLSQGLPSETKLKVRKSITDYVNSVIDEEWEAMSHRSYSKDAVIDVHNLWNTLIGCEPEKSTQQDIRSMALEEMRNLSDCRRKRLLSSIHGVSPILWAALILGGALTIMFTYFFGLSSLPGQIMMTVIVSTCLSLNIYLVFLFGYPFSGIFRLPPEGFIANRAIIKIFEKGIESVPENYDLQKLKDNKGRIDPDLKQ